MRLPTPNWSLSASVRSRNDRTAAPMEKNKPLDPVATGRDGHPAPDGAAAARPLTVEAHPALAILKRYGPLVCLGAAMLLVLGMGWHRQVTLENIVALRDRFHHVLETHKILAVLVYIAFYI